MKKDKIKILAWGDYCCSTGFATVMSNIMMELEATGRYEIDVIAINYSGDPYNKERFPGNVWPAMPGVMAGAGSYGDVYGRQRVLDRIGTGEYDVLFMVNDTFIVQEFYKQIQETKEAVEKLVGKTFRTVHYFPIDAPPKPDWAELVAQMDFPVAYTNYARDEIAKYQPQLKEMPVIYHGTNLKDFFPITDKKEIAAFRNHFFKGKADDRFLITNVNRNQSRKDTVRNLMVLQELKNRGLNPYMYLHMQHSDAGGNILVMAEQFGLNVEEDFGVPNPAIFSANQGLPIEAVNWIYNASDAVFTPTLGEGWGLSLTEAMATKTPIIAPANTSINEILADGRGILIPCGDTPSNWIVKEMDNERMRPLMNVMAAADAIEKLMKGEELSDLQAAWEWVQKLSWGAIAKQWVPIIDAAAAETKSFVPAVQDSEFMSRAQRRKFERDQKKKGK